MLTEVPTFHESSFVRMELSRALSRRAAAVPTSAASHHKSRRGERCQMPRVPWPSWRPAALHGAVVAVAVGCWHQGGRRADHAAVVLLWAAVSAAAERRPLRGSAWLCQHHAAVTAATASAALLADGASERFAQACAVLAGELVGSSLAATVSTMADDRGRARSGSNSPRGRPQEPVSLEHETARTMPEDSLPPLVRVGPTMLELILHEHRSGGPEENAFGGKQFQAAFRARRGSERGASGPFARAGTAHTP